MELAFVPRKLVPLWRMNGYAPVPGYESPKGWAILMHNIASAELPAEPAGQPALHERFTSNVSRSRSVANTLRHAKARAMA